jgi:hypothetical protein
MAEPTQMIVIQVPLDIDLKDTTSESGKVWERVLELLRQQPGYRRLYWGRRVEDPEDVQIHVGNASSSVEVFSVIAQLSHLVASTEPPRATPLLPRLSRLFNIPLLIK